MRFIAKLFRWVFGKNQPVIHRSDIRPINYNNAVTYQQLSEQDRVGRSWSNQMSAISYLTAVGKMSKEDAACESGTDRFKTNMDTLVSKLVLKVGGKRPRYIVSDLVEELLLQRSFMVSMDSHKRKLSIHFPNGFSIVRNLPQIAQHPSSYNRSQRTRKPRVAETE